jgi:hypothetical protein
VEALRLVGLAVPASARRRRARDEGSLGGLLCGQRHIGDFTRWQEHDAYSKALERLLRDLKVEAS